MKLLMTGNEAIARGAYEAGVRFASAYRGTPSTEILENVATYKEDIVAEWATNEKVALEAAIGGSIAGARTMASMKHVGVNVAADPLFTFSYTGVNGGMVLITADEPGMHSSQNEQDNRNYAKFAKIAMFEPSTSQEAKDMLKEAFEISEKYDTPVLFRVTTRLCHSKGIVECIDRVEVPIKEYIKNPKKNLPRAIIMCMLLVSVLYMAILAVSIGVLGTDLANTKAPVQDAFNVIVGPIGMYIVLVGTLISMGGINFAEAYYAPRVATSMAEDGMLPSALAKRNRYNAPYIAAIVTAIASVLLAWSGSFTTLAAISAVSRFTQYLPTCLAVIIFRRKWADKARSYTIPGGYLIPVIAIGTSLWMLAQAQTNQLLWGLGGCIVILPFYYSYWKKKKAGLIKDHDEM